MLAALMIGPHLSISACVKALRSFGVPPAGCAPTLARNSLVAGSCSQSLVAALSLVTTSGGTLAGARSAYQTLASKPGMPDSDTVGTSGSIDQRVAEAIASALIFPDLTGPRYGVAESMAMSIWLPMRSGSIAAAPLYCAALIEMPAVRFKSSPVM